MSEYDLSGGTLVRFEFEFEKKTARLNMRLPASLLAAVKNKAAKRGIPYQRFVREALERALGAGRDGRRAEESGSLFDLRRNTPEDIARVLVEACAPSRAEGIARAILREIKRRLIARIYGRLPLQD